MYPKYVFNLDEVHKWHNIDISLNKLYNQVLRQQGIASPLPQSIASTQRPQRWWFHVPLRVGKAAMVNRIALSKDQFATRRADERCHHIYYTWNQIQKGCTTNMELACFAFNFIPFDWQGCFLLVLLSIRMQTCVSSMGPSHQVVVSRSEWKWWVQLHGNLRRRKKNFF